MADVSFTAPPTCAKFMKSEAFGRLIAGPVGSGKTTACIFELLRRAINQEKAPDGRRYTKFAVTRQTLRQLKDTVVKDCQNWIGPLGSWKVSDSAFNVEFDDVYSEWLFVPMEDAEDRARLLSMQLTGGWLSECIEMDLDVLGPLGDRLGRYPSGNRGIPSWHGWIADTNFPQLMSPWQTYMENPPLGVSIFKQPSGLAEDAGAGVYSWLI